VVGWTEVAVVDWTMVLVRVVVVGSTIV